jgi:cytochrome c553
MRLRSSNVTVAAATVAVVAFAGCAGGLDPGVSFTGTGGTGSACVPNGGTTTPAATFDTVKMAFSDHGAVSACASAPCHGAGGMEPPPPSKPLVLQQDATLYTNLMSYVSHACGDIPLVNPGKPDESGLIKILSGACGTTLRMPFGCSGEQCLSDAEIAAISQWIANCAPQQ